MKSIILYPDGSSYEGQGEYPLTSCGACEPVIVNGELVHRHPGGMHCTCHVVEPA